MLAEERQAFVNEATYVVTGMKHDTEAAELRLREELQLAQMAQATSAENASNADSRCAQVYQEAQTYIQEMQQQSQQHQIRFEGEAQSAKQTFEIQKARIAEQTREITEQRLMVEKQAGELKEQQRLMNEQREMYVEQTEQTRRMMDDYRNLREDFENLKSKHAEQNQKRDNNMSEGRMPMPDETPNFSTFPGGEQKQPEGNDHFDLFGPPKDHPKSPKADPFQSNDPWKGYKPTGPTGFPMSYGDCIMDRQGF